MSTRGAPFRPVRVGRRRRASARPALSVPLKRALHQIVDSKLSNVQEHKVFDVVTTGATVTSTAAIYDRTAVTQGDTSTSRDGAAVSANLLILNALVLANGAALDNAIRLIVFQWHEDDAFGAPVVSDILSDATQPWLSPYNWPARLRYRILYDRLYPSTYTSSTSSVPIHLELKLGHMITFSSANNGSGHVYVLWVSDEAANGPAVAFTTRLHFTDS